MSASRARMSANESRRCSGASAAQGGGPPGRNDSGRGIRCWPPRRVTTVTIVSTPCETPAPMDTRAPLAPEWNLATAFESVADSLPDRVALIQGDRRISWRSFDERAARIAHAFLAAAL